MQGTGGVYPHHLSLSKPDSILQISFPSVIPAAAVGIALCRNLALLLTCAAWCWMSWPCFGKGERGKLSL